MMLFFFEGKGTICQGRQSMFRMGGGGAIFLGALSAQSRNIKLLNIFFSFFLLVF